MGFNSGFKGLKNVKDRRTKKVAEEK